MDGTNLKISKFLTMDAFMVSIYLVQKYEKTPFYFADSYDDAYERQEAILVFRDTTANEQSDSSDEEEQVIEENFNIIVNVLCSEAPASNQ